MSIRPVTSFKLQVFTNYREMKNLRRVFYLHLNFSNTWHWNCLCHHWSTHIVLFPFISWMYFMPTIFKIKMNFLSFCSYFSATLYWGLGLRAWQVRFVGNKNGFPSFHWEAGFTFSWKKGVMGGETRCGGNDGRFPAALPRQLAQSKCWLDLLYF